MRRIESGSTSRVRRTEGRNHTLFGSMCVLRQRIENEAARANHRFREFELASFARELLLRIASSAESGFPFGIAFCFNAQKALGRFPIGDRQIVNSAQAKFASSFEQLQGAILVSVNARCTEAFVILPK